MAITMCSVRGCRRCVAAEMRRRRQRLLYPLLCALALAAVALGLARVHEAQASAPPATPAMQRAVAKVVGHAVKGLKAECRGRVCAAYTTGDNSLNAVLVRHRNGSEYRVASVMLPDVSVQR